MPTRKKIVAMRTAAVTASTNALVVATAGPVLINGDSHYDPANPHTWMPLVGDPPGSVGLRVMWGVLRIKRYHDPSGDPTPNSAAAFAAAKLRPSWSPDPRAITAARAEVLAPPGVDDSWADPWLFAVRLDLELGRDADGKTALLGYATITDPAATSLHTFWEEVRDVARALVTAHGCAILAVVHAPGRAGSDNRLHAHLAIVPCRLTGALGLSGRIAIFCGDKGRQVVLEAWRNRRRFFPVTAATGGSGM